MASNPAEITAVEHESNMVQFNMCVPVNGKITGNAARTVLMKSGLPPPMLGQIWSLSDLDHDGHLDQREFSIAMKLTRNCLAGIPLPPALPPSLLNVPLSGSAPRSPLPSSMPPVMGMMGSQLGGPPPMMAPPVRPLGAPPMPGAYPLAGMAMGTPPGAMAGAAFPHYATGPRGSIGSVGGSPAKTAPPLPGRPAASTFPGKQLDNWTMPQPSKLKYAQQFNGIDKQRAGFLNGPAARNALGQSGLPTHALAHVWTLADVNKDGRLSVEEFSIAMWLIDQHKTGFALPAEIPPELAALTHHGSARSDSPATPSGEAPAQKVSTPKTFEDKRKDNYDRGQAELDRRRQQLQEEEDRRKAEIAKREREAEDKRERERQEQERRREAERQAEMERQRQMEEERLEHERKRAAERERIRVDKEKEMKKVMLEKRKRELMAQKSAAAEKTATAEQKKKTLQFQLQALNEKHTDIEGEVETARKGIETITKEIEGMRAVRDEKLAAIAEAQKENQTSAVQAEQLAHQLLQLQGANRDATERAAGLDELISRRAAAVQKVEDLKRQVNATRERNSQQRENVTSKEKELAGGLRGEVDKLRAEHAAGLARAEEKRRELHARLHKAAAASTAASSAAPAMAAAAAPAPGAMYDAPPGDISFQQPQSIQQSCHQSPAKESPIASSPPSTLYDTPPVVPDSSFSNGHHGTSSNGPLPPASAATVKYRSIYAFESRSTDELSFQPGDVILVFEGHAAEPGWLAGQIKEKVGWFPAAFAEPIAPVNTNVTSPMQTVPANVTPSPSLEKILEEPNASSPAPASTATLQSPTRNGLTLAGVEGAAGGEESVLCVCTAQFPWKARNTGDLSFGKGDTIEVLEKTDMKWRGRKSGDGTIGWFPKSYVKVTDETPRASTASSSRQASVVSGGGGASSSATPTSGSAHSFPATSASSSHSINSVIAAHPPATAGTPLSSTGGEWYVANYDFDAVETTDLPLRAGDRILVLEKKDDWWKGSANGREGIFPANYVVALEGATHAAAHIANQAAAAAAAAPAAAPPQKAKVIASFQAAGDNQLSLAMNDIVFVRSKSDAGWWEGELRDAAGGVKIGWFPGDYVQLETSSALTSPLGQSYVAMFDYAASQADELSFKTGDTVMVTAQSDAEWWTGHVVGAVPAHSGLFPANYVQPR